MSIFGYTLVQHSGYGYGGNPQFRLAVETCPVDEKEAHDVLMAFGRIYSTYEEADAAEYVANYPPGVNGLIPKVAGSFADVRLQGLRVYMPIPGVRDLGRRVEEEIRPGFTLRSWDKMPRHYQLFRDYQVGVYRTRVGAERAADRLIAKDQEMAS